MAWLALLLIVVAFGAMALALSWTERAEERRILARAEAILAPGAIAYVAPDPDVGRRDEVVLPAAAAPDAPLVAPAARVRSIA